MINPNFLDFIVSEIWATLIERIYKIYLSFVGVVKF